MLATTSQLETVAALREQLQAPAAPSQPVFYRGLDGLISGGVRRGSLIECLSEGGSGAVALSLVIAQAACQAGQALVVIDRSRRFYPPAATPLGVDSETILVRPQNRQDELWALHQSLRCPGVGAVVCWPNKLDGRLFRALQLAAESSGAVGLLVQPISVRGHPSWSDVQLVIEALPTGGKRRRLRVDVVRCRSGQQGSAVVELDDESGALHVVTELAAPAGRPRTSRA